MHVPEKWQMNSLTDMHQFIAQHGFAVVMSSNLEASHIPLVLKAAEGEYGVLYGHLAHSNPHWKDIIDSSVLCIFNGPHAYISPTWYHASPAVPTWNYSVVHAKGTVEFTDDKTTMAILETTIQKYEPSLLTPTPESPEGFIPKQFQDKLAKGIVGFKIVITELQGKQKLGQHRSSLDQLGVIAGLSKSTGINEQQLLKYMVDNNIALG
ncbi:FMN-binding negative transcriptional regulator [Shewanella glacialimarina]|uniref:FMN-binding negative transcriptional regulator n=1 Tax=Shewanella glacialimarina TaxID=2590884 RepID=UPI001CF8E2EE|nr:FMN-binding negative transcriptional regulator [Shewanella glacialimarina]UCX05644.1 FMN-binding negative transcriptional regulator [Shewanella glacialimarina]